MSLHQVSALADSFSSSKSPCPSFSEGYDGSCPSCRSSSSAHFCLSLFRPSCLVCQCECMAQQNSHLMASKRKGNFIQILLLFLLLSIAFGSLNSLEDEGHAPLTAPRPAFVICLQGTVASHVIGVVCMSLGDKCLSQGCFSVRWNTPEVSLQQLLELFCKAWCLKWTVISLTW